MSDEKPVTAAELAAVIVKDRWLRNTILVGYAPAGWWECDVMEITDAGYWHEFEIKTSRADFKADARKQSRGVRKHDLLAARSSKGPNRFSFLTPAGLLAPGDVPEWAGLIEGKRIRANFISVRIVKSAPRLHDAKDEGGRRRGIFQTCYYRFHRLPSTARVLGVDESEFHEGAGI